MTGPLIQLLRPKNLLLAQDSAPIHTSNPTASTDFPPRAHSVTTLPTPLAQLPQALPWTTVIAP